jgi:hypothetical protein
LGNHNKIKPISYLGSLKYLPPPPPNSKNLLGEKFKVWNLIAKGMKMLIYTPIKSLAPSNEFNYVFGAMGRYLAYPIFSTCPWVY